MFRDDFEFNDAAGPSHHGGKATPAPVQQILEPTANAATQMIEAARPSPTPSWLADAETELKKIPFFVRAKARRNTEQFAAEKGVDRDLHRHALRGKGPLCAMTATHRRT